MEQERLGVNCLVEFHDLTKSVYLCGLFAGDRVRDRSGSLLPVLCAILETREGKS